MEENIDSCNTQEFDPRCDMEPKMYFKSSDLLFARQLAEVGPSF